MSEERSRILKMLDKGKINVEEANELLLTIRASNYQYVEAGNRVNKKTDTSAPLEIIVNENGEKIKILVKKIY